MDDERGRVLSSRAVTRTARAGVVAWSLIGLAILAYLTLRYVVYPVRVIFPPLVVALVLVYLLNPIVRRLEPRIGRLLGALITYLFFLAIVVVGLRFLIPAIGDQVGEFAKSVPKLLARAQANLQDLADRLGIDFDAGSVVGGLSPEGSGGEFIASIFSVTAGVLHAAVVFILGPILAFYLLVDLPKIQRGVQALIPARRRAEVEGVLEKMGRALGGFFRGQLLIALFVGLASMLALYIVGLPYWALVGMIAGLFNLIPLVGPFLAAIPALFIAFTTPDSGGLLALDPGLPLAVGAGLGLLTVQQIDNHIISPNVVARTVKLHPVTVMLGLLVGGTLLGLWGMLLAVPTIAAIKILLLHYWDTRMQWPPPAPEEDVAATPPEARLDPAGDGIPVEPGEARPRRNVRDLLRRRRPAAGRTGRQEG
ncbi:MAG: AI-2E family transporter [Actinobacteria bacterium]|nr:AI-2E family transporter [Actinomycetota bacterium]